ncbi:hypothetical protein U0070_020332 [Myodes glareolus]|uniref:Uncharacterized protein n=1 Tax=Myodes glareolus TaxID=447135 RepID=A0AAW0HJD2_MYOGA
MHDTATRNHNLRFLVVPASSSSLFSHRIRFLLADSAPPNRLSVLLKCKPAVTLGQSALRMSHFEREAPRPQALL